MSLINVSIRLASGNADDRRDVGVYRRGLPCPVTHHDRTVTTEFDLKVHGKLIGGRAVAQLDGLPTKNHAVSVSNHKHIAAAIGAEVVPEGGDLRLSLESLSGTEVVKSYHLRWCTRNC